MCGGLWLQGRTPTYLCLHRRLAPALRGCTAPELGRGDGSDRGATQVLEVSGTRSTVIRITVPRTCTCSEGSEQLDLVLSVHLLAHSSLVLLLGGYVVWIGILKVGDMEGYWTGDLRRERVLCVGHVW